MKINDILQTLESMTDPDAVEGMAKFGIIGKKVYGIKIPYRGILTTYSKKNSQYV